MMNSLVENQIIEFAGGKEIVNRETLSNAFNMRCEKFTIKKKSFVAKYYTKKIDDFNSVVSETKSLMYLSKKFLSLFPSIKYKSKELLIIEYIKANHIKNSDYQEKLAKKILKLHMVTNNKYGFSFDTQVGGLKQPNNYENDWVNFFLENRLNMIFEEINKKNPMPNEINKKIQILMNDLNNRLPQNPKISLLHGDLWEGNILFNNGDLVSLIDPGIFFGHNEMEIAYLTWFKYTDHNFLNYYSNTIKIDKDYSHYEPIYQLFFSLLNVHLWNRDLYLKDTNKLLKKII